MVIFGDIQANYVYVSNPVYSESQIEILSNPDTPENQRVDIYASVANPPFSAEELALLNNSSVSKEEKTLLLNTHNCNTYISSGPTNFGLLGSENSRASVTIDGVAQNPERGDLKGEWWWQVGTGSTLAYNLLIG
jgi:hypothetical protein